MTMPRKKEAEKNLSIAFGSNTSSHLIRTIARRFISNAVRRAADDLFLLRDDAEVRCRSFLGREHLDASLSAGRGVMLVSPHWYANRISNRYLATLGYPVMTVRNQEPPDRFIGRLGESSLQAQYIHLLHNVIRDEVFIQDPECTLKILRRLRKGGIVEMHLDAPFSRHLIMQSFLGQRVLMPAGPLHLIRTSGCAVLFKLAFGNADSLQIQIEPSVEIDNTLPIDTLCKSNLSALIKSMESHILEHPDQWELWTKL
jgi:KDO2-lipid IV(A) lauroyltransferase